MIVDPKDRNCASQIAQRFEAIVEFSNDAIISKDLLGTVTTWNPAATRIFGYTAEEIIGKPVSILIPLERQDEEYEIIERIRRGECVDHYETVRRRKDGNLVNISLTISPIKDAEGTIVGASKIARDITESKRAAEKQRLLFREMNHRVNNLLTLAGGIVTLSARSAKSPKDLAEQVRTRLKAVASAHELMLRGLVPGSDTSKRRTDMASLIRAIISPYSDMEQGSNSRIAAAGLDISIGENSVTSWALLLHEFTTNAVKYGALSSPDGHIDIKWALQNDHLSLTWRETGGPALTEEPRVEGFGTVLINATLKGQLAGQLSRAWNSEGLTIELSAPLASLAA
jgi:PAS domain S-box-containing protein